MTEEEILISGSVDGAICAWIWDGGHGKKVATFEVFLLFVFVLILKTGVEILCRGIGRMCHER